MATKYTPLPSSACSKCASLQLYAGREVHFMLKRQSVRQRFLDVFESYECLDCRTQWERVIFTEDKHPTTYLWKLKSPAINQQHYALPAADTDLDHALASWIKPTCEEPVYA